MYIKYNMFYLCARCNHLTKQKIEMVRHLNKIKKCDNKYSLNKTNDEIYKLSLTKHYDESVSIKKKITIHKFIFVKSAIKPFLIKEI